MEVVLTQSTIILTSPRRQDNIASASSTLLGYYHTGTVARHPELSTRLCYDQSSSDIRKTRSQS